MLRYAKVINEETKLCSVGIGTNYDYYESIGMLMQDVEKAWNGNWYLAGHTPEKPADVVKQERIQELHKLLADHDYWTSKYADGEYTDEEWAERVAQRKAWRNELRELEQ